MTSGTETSPRRFLGIPIKALLRGSDKAAEPEEPAEEPAKRISFADRSNGAVEALRASALGSLRVEEVMVPRTDIVAVDSSATHEKVMRAFRDCKHSRLPVYRESLDDPLGFLHLKDLALDPDWMNASADSLLNPRHVRNALFVPPSMGADELFRDMQARRIHMALVIDEFGGVDGLVTIEDLVEEIVGDIEDEHDPTSTRSWWREDKNVYRSRSRTLIGEFEEACGVQLIPENGEDIPETLGGLVFMLTGRVPARGEVVAHPDGHEFEILEADPRRIRLLRVKLRPVDKKKTRKPG